MRRAAICAFAVCACAAGCAPARFVPASEASSYRAVYRVEERTPGEVEVRTEVREVRRPFDGRVEVLGGEPPGRGVRSGSVVNRVYQWALGAGGRARVGFRRPPGGSVGDASYAAFRDAARAGVVRALGRGEALGRKCSWFAYEETTGPLTPPTESSRVESCVDGTGIMLRQAWSIRGMTVRTIEVQSVEEDVDDERFLADRRPKVPKAGDLDPQTLVASRVALHDHPHPGRLGVELDRPRGYRLRRDAVVAESGGGQGQTPSQVFSQAYVRGTELVVVERSTSPNLRPTWSPSEGASVKLGSLGPGRLVYFPDRVELRLVGTRGYARIVAPSRGTALAFGRRLRAA